MELIFHGHSCMAINLAGGTKLLMDPFITGNPQSDLTVDTVKADYVLVSHGHEQSSGDMLQVAKNNRAPIIGVEELVAYAESQGCQGEPLNLGAKHDFPFGRVKLMHAQHSSSLEVNGVRQYMGDACGFLIQAEGKTIYYTGDTSNFGDMAIFGKAYDIDVVILPIGDRYTMGPKEAALCAQRLNAKKVIPVHYNTFPDIQQDPNDLVNAMAPGVVEVMQPGDHFQV